MDKAPKLSDRLIIAATGQGTILVGVALFLGIDGLLLTGWLVALAAAAGVASGYKIAGK